MRNRNSPNEKNEINIAHDYIISKVKCPRCNAEHEASDVCSKSVQDYETYANRNKQVVSADVTESKQTESEISLNKKIFSSS